MFHLGTVRQGDTIVFSAACSGEAKKGQDFFPLQVDYREKYSAAGKFPGGYIKRKGRPSDKEILICRMADRPIRPLFPEGFFDEVQVCGLLLSADGVNEGDVLSMLGASTALCLSDLPFQGPIGAVRVGCIDGEFIANPTIQEMEKSTLELVYAGLPDKVIMIEGEAKGRPSDKEILICRMADRPIRPLFPEGFFDEVQVCGLLLSADGVNEGDVLSMLGASTAPRPA